MTNPTPVAWISEGGDVSRSFLYFEQMGFKNSHPLYTEAQLNQARADALAECQRERDEYLRDLGAMKNWIADWHKKDAELATVIKERDELVATLIECRSSVKFDLNRYERMALDYSRLGPEGEGKLAIADAEANRLHRLIDTIDALAKLGADKTGEV